MLLGQFISYLLYDLRQASVAKRVGRYYHAVSILIDAIQELYYQNKSDAEQLKVWEKSFDAIPLVASAHAEKVSTDRSEIIYFRMTAKNRLAQPLYREIHRNIWKKLHDMGYFKMEKWRPTTKRDTMFDEQT